mmetsp:Transcript_1855/g.4219  ORF Transcript_1855/g.4219 Transcript_1855/m.4219 type:complete len:237 (-) Transcript_1855:314-1024(-)
MSASSNTTWRMCTAAGAKLPRRHPPALNWSTSSTARAGVATTTSGSEKGSMVSGVSADVRSKGRPSSPTSEFATLATCSQSVALGHNIRAPSLPVRPSDEDGCPFLRRLDHRGARYVRVLPLPVSAATTTSVPAAIAGIARDWMPVPVEKPRLPSAVTTAGCIAGMSANGVASSPVAAAVTPGDTSPAAAAAAAGGKRRRKGTTSRVEKRRRSDRLSDAEGQRATVKAPAAAVVDG